MKHRHMVVHFDCHAEQGAILCFITRLLTLLPSQLQKRIYTMNVQDNVILSVSVQNNGCFTGSSDRPLFSGETYYHF